MDGKSRKLHHTGIVALTAAFVSMWTFPAAGQVPVDADGKPLGDSTELPVEGAGTAANEGAELLSPAELADLVGPVALYPDDLLAIVLPASSYPLEIVQAARFLEQLEQDSSLKPSEEWDESVTALLNYPEVVRMMDEDIDWTWKLGDAFVNQQADVIAAVEAFRDRAYAAGNLKSDERQTVSNEDGIIEIVPVDDDVIYVPYYEPERVLVRQVRPVYYYYPRPYPVYYYPYPVGYAFYDDYFWGVTTAFRIAWHSHYLHVHHHSYWGHPYYGHSYYGHYYRRPSVHIYNRWYVNNARHYHSNRYRDGDYWRPRHRAGDRPDYYSTRTRSYRDRDVRGGRDVRSTYSSQGTRNGVQADARRPQNDAIRFRSRDETRSQLHNDAGRESRSAGRDDTRTESRQVNPRQEQRNESRNGRPDSAAHGRDVTNSTAGRTAERNGNSDSRIAFRDRPATANPGVQREARRTEDRNRGADTGIAFRDRPATANPGVQQEARRTEDRNRGADTDIAFRDRPATANPGVQREARRTEDRNRGADTGIAFRDRPVSINRDVRRESLRTDSARSNEPVQRLARPAERRDVSVNRQSGTAGATRSAPVHRDTRSVQRHPVQTSPQHQTSRQSYAVSRSMRSESARVAPQAPSRHQAPRASESRAATRQAAPTSRDSAVSQRSRNR